MEIARTTLVEKIHTALAGAPVTMLTGPRQVGKTTLARDLLDEDFPNYFDFEDPVSLACLEEPRIALESLKGLVVSDEIQRRPDLFPVLRVLADRRGSETCFWATHEGAEIDLLLRRGDRLLGVECERTDAPKLTASICIALDDLGLERAAVIYPGAKRYPLGDPVEAVPLKALATPGSLFEGESPAA